MLELKEGFEREKTDRSAKETEILKKLSEEAANIAQLIEKHKQGRIARISEVKEECKDETKLQAHYISQFEKQATGEFSKVRKHLEDEMAGRFAHQDEIVDNLQKVIKQFQGTLKLFGKNV